MWKTNVKHTFIAVILSVGQWGANLLENQTLRVFFFFQILWHFSKTSQVNRIGNKKLRLFFLVQKLRKFPGLVKEYYIMSIILRLMLYSNICFFFAVRSNKEYSAGSKWYMDQIHTVSTPYWSWQDGTSHITSMCKTCGRQVFPMALTAKVHPKLRVWSAGSTSDIFSLWKFGGIFKWSQNHQPQQSNKSWWNMICSIFHG